MSKLKIGCYATVTSLVAVTIACIILLFTAPGAELVLTLSQRFFPGTLRWHSLSGSLIGGVRLKQATYRHDNMILKARLVTARPDTTRLRHGVMAVKSLTIQKLHLQNSSAAAPPDKSLAHSLYDISAQGQIALRTPHRMQWRLHVQGGKQDNALNADVRLQGDPDNIKITQGIAKFLGGTLMIGGNLSIKPEFSWQLKLQGQEINPGRQWPDWQGQLSFATILSGQNTAATGNAESTQHITWNMQKLAGVLNGQPVTGAWQLSLTPQHSLTIKNGSLSVGDNRLSAAGTLDAENGLLQWRLDAPQLRQITPDWQGSAIGSGTFGGNPDKLTDLDANTCLSLNNLQIGVWRARSVQIDFVRQRQAAKKITLHIEGHKLALSGHIIKRLRVEVRGTTAAQQWSGQLETPTVDIMTAAEGGMRDDTWQGQLIRFDVNNPGMDELHLQNAIQLTISNKKIDTEPFCLQNTETNLCGRLHWQARQQLTAELNGKNFPLDFFNRWLPTTFSVAGGANFQSHAAWTANGKQSGTLSFTLPQLRLHNNILDQTLIIHNLDMHATFDQTGLHIAADAQHKAVEAQVELTKFSVMHTKLSRQALSGTISLNIPDIGFINALSDNIDQTQGLLTGKVKLSGTVTRPDMQGDIVLANGQVHLIPAGITLKNIHIKAHLQQKNKIVLQGSVDSPAKVATDKKNKSDTTPHDGTAEFSGYTHWLPPFTGQVKIKSNHFLVADTPQYQIVADADMTLHYRRPALKLSGTLHVSRATVKPKDFSSVVTLPENVVYADRDQRATHLFADLQLSAEKVDFSYQGADAQLQGRLRMQKEPTIPWHATGKLSTTKGSYSAYRQNLNITKGELLFTGGAIDNPTLDIRAVRQIQTAQNTQLVSGDTPSQVGVHVQGSLKSPQISLFAVPDTLSQTDILSYLLFGRGRGNIGPTQNKELLLAASSAGLDMLGTVGSLRQRLGLTRLGIGSSEVYNKESGEMEHTTSLTIGKKITDKLSAQYSIGLLQPINILELIYRLNHHWQIQTNNSSLDTGADIIFSIRRD